MTKTIRIILMILGLGLAIGGLGFMFAPTYMETDFGIVPSRLDGFGSIRADLGGMFLALAFFTALSARPGEHKWILVPAVFMALILFGRGLHMILDGISDYAIRSFTVEVVVLVFLIWARRYLDQNREGS